MLSLCVAQGTCGILGPDKHLPGVTPGFLLLFPVSLHVTITLAFPLLRDAPGGLCWREGKHSQTLAGFRGWQSSNNTQTGTELVLNLTGIPGVLLPVEL